MRKYRDRRHRAKEIISAINEKGEKRRREWDIKHREKIKIYRDKLSKVECIDMAPSSAKQYLDNVKVFKSSEVQPQMPAGPMICDSSIAISKDEYAFLVKGPQFMVRQKLNEDDFKVEIEKMITKHKYQTCNQDGEDTKSEEKKENKKDEEDKRLEMLGEIEEARSRMTYNRSEKVLDMGNLRASDYKYNKHVQLPDTVDACEEARNEIRRTEHMKSFKKIVNQLADENISNLTKSEQRGLKSLRKRVNKGEIVVTETDKSKRFCILTREQYEASGQKHTRNDTIIEEKTVKKIQNVTNEHCRWIKEIFGTGSNWQHEERLGSSMNDQCEAVAPLYLLVKDHKGWEEKSGQPPPSRPVCSGIRGYNRHLSELVSLILEPISHSIEGADIDSTSALLDNIEKLNKERKQVQDQRTVTDKTQEEEVEQYTERKETKENRVETDSTDKEKAGIREFSRELKRKRIQKLRGMKGRDGVIPNFKAKL